MDEEEKGAFNGLVMANASLNFRSHISAHVVPMLLCLLILLLNYENTPLNMTSKFKVHLDSNFDEISPVYSKIQDT